MKMDGYERWKAAAVANLKGVIRGLGDGPNRFAWCDWGVIGPPWREVPRVGCVFHYHAGRDLTAYVLLWWFGHSGGDAPPFHLDDIRSAMGGLWDEDVEYLVWPWPREAASPAA